MIVSSSLSIADIGDDVTDSRPEIQCIEKAGLGRRVECVARDIRAELSQPLGEPRTLETGMAGDEDTFPAIGIRESHTGTHHTFHGACLLCHRLSSKRTSRNVSMLCQNDS